jgi:hypothetical protein
MLETKKLKTKKKRVAFMVLSFLYLAKHQERLTALSKLQKNCRLRKKHLLKIYTICLRRSAKKVRLSKQITEATRQFSQANRARA